MLALASPKSIWVFWPKNNGLSTPANPGLRLRLKARSYDPHPTRNGVNGVLNFGSFILRKAGFSVLGDLCTDFCKSFI